jgi:hypothetical protein
MANNPLGLLQEALVLSETLLPLETKLRQAKKEGLIKADYLGYQIDEATKAGVINAKEATRLRDYHDKVSSLLAVDDFAPDELQRAGARSEPAEAVTETSVPNVQVGDSMKKKVARKSANKKSTGNKASRRKTAAKKTSKKKK